MLKWLAPVGVLIAGLIMLAQAQSPGLSRPGQINVYDFLTPAQQAASVTYGNTTDVTGAINDAVAACGRGCTLYFPAGYYYSTNCNFQIQQPMIIVGAGMGDTNIPQVQAGSVLACDGGTQPAFNVTATWFKLQDMEILDAAVSRTTGAGVLINSASSNFSGFTVENSSIIGFQDGVNVVTGQSWWIKDSMIANSKRYNIFVSDVINNDHGDWDIHHNLLYTNATGTCVVRVESGGGGRIIGNKISPWTSNTSGKGICVDTTASSTSSQLVIEGNSIDSVSGASSNAIIDIKSTWKNIIISGNSLITHTSGSYAIKLTNCASTQIGENTIQLQAGGNAAVSLNNCSGVSMGQQQVQGAGSSNPAAWVTVSGGSPPFSSMPVQWFLGLNEQYATIYSAAGTALPTCNAPNKGITALVSDATAPTYLATYTSGGAVFAFVLCNGTNWVTP